MNLLQKIKRQPPGRIIALGFALVIFIGSGLLMLPCSVKDGVVLHYIDALYTSTSAVCVTGLLQWMQVILLRRWANFSSAD